jgi:hypothetical protein
VDYPQRRLTGLRTEVPNSEVSQGRSVGECAFCDASGVGSGAPAARPTLPSRIARCPGSYSGSDLGRFSQYQRFTMLPRSSVGFRAKLSQPHSSQPSAPRSIRVWWTETMSAPPVRRASPFGSNTSVSSLASVSSRKRATRTHAYSQRGATCPAERLTTPADTSPVREQAANRR